MAESEVLALIKRLEAVTARLEKLERQIQSVPETTVSASASNVPTGGDSSASVREFDELVNTSLKAYFDAAAKLGGEVNEQAKVVSSIVQKLRTILSMAASSKKPSDADFEKLMAPYDQEVSNLSTFKEKYRSSKFFNHLSAVSEGAPALEWVRVTPAPAPHIEEFRNSAQFYANKVLKDHKGEEPHPTLVNQWIAFLKGLEAYVKQWHTTGLSWNPKGSEAHIPSTSSAVASGGTAAPPPPPPPPPADLSDDNSAAKSKASASAPDMSEVFAQINQGNVTAGLRKVTKEMKTKYQPNKPSGLVPAKEEKESASKATEPKAAPKRPPKLALEGSKWIVEYQVGNRDLVIDIKDIKQSVCIFRCENSLVRINGKVNSIAIDSCKKTSVVFENSLASCEIVNCTSLEVQCLGKVPTITVDKTRGCQIFLSKEGAPETDVITSESSEINVNVPKPDGSDVEEFPIPTQYKSNYKNGKLVTEVVEHTG
jgi:adenylyl cyclase-associated protein